ncbi:MAG: type II secretion system protein GspK, partial [Gammaproteobacteria bacterium]|nr:type II secretion system protein GspK [Gammaproteobacteria bacterium]
MNKPSRQTGVALITALVIIALGSVLATNIVWDTHIDQRRASNLLSADQALQYALGAEDWVSHIMRRDDTKIDFLGEDWATELPPLPVEGGQIT